MYYIGIISYILTVASYLLFPSVKNMLNQAALLAPQITYACGFLYFSPLLVFLCHMTFKLKSRKHYLLLATQTKLAASVSVSLGLIGTFIGLTDMVSAIASSLGGEGDITAKMATMISSISSAMNAMAFAFLTSIIGVAVSVLLLVSLNFWEFYYGTDKNKKNAGSTYDNTELEFFLQKLEHLEFINTSIANKLVNIPENSNITELLLDNSSVMAMRLIDIDTSIVKLYEMNQGLISKLTQSIEQTATSLDVILDNESTTKNQMQQSIEQLMILNASIHGLASSYQENTESNKKSHSEKLEKLSCIINNQNKLVQQQNDFKTKCKKALEVLVNEN